MSNFTIHFSSSLQFLSIPVYTIFKNLTIILIAYGELLWCGGSVTRLMLVSFVLMVKRLTSYSTNMLVFCHHCFSHRSFTCLPYPTGSVFYNCCMARHRKHDGECRAIRWCHRIRMDAVQLLMFCCVCIDNEEAHHHNKIQRL